MGTEVKEGPMTLAEFRGVLIDSFERSIAIPRMVLLQKHMMASLLRQPLISFDSGYENFLEQISESPEMYDAWASMVFDIISSVGPTEVIIKEVNSLISAFSKSVPGANQMDYLVEKEDISFLVAVVYRITISMLTLKDPEETPSVQGA